MQRNIKSLDELRLPMCPIPRPGDEVCWYSDAVMFSGTLWGHALDGLPVVRSEFGNMYRLPTYDQLRFMDPESRLAPNWHFINQQASIMSPTDDEIREFDRLLSQRTPPGPQYIELFYEIWSRGYEIFLVGGTVRDVLSNTPTNDVDVVTSMPLQKSLPLIQSMYRSKPSISKENGFVRIGGSPGSGDPFIDLKMFSHSDLGTSNAIFGNNLDLDLEHRDFACNSIYYDPINKALIDPSGRGITDAENRILFVVCNTSRRIAFMLGQIGIRFFKFRSFGFTATTGTDEIILRDFVPAIQAIPRSVRMRYLKTQLLSKKPRHEHRDLIQEFKSQMIGYGEREVWDQYFQPYVQEILT